MKEYNNIERVNTLDDGNMSVLMKNGKEAIVEIIRLNEKFQAAVYRLFTPELNENPKREDKFIKLVKHEGYKECAKEALGWIDENLLDYQPEEIKEFK